MGYHDGQVKQFGYWLLITNVHIGHSTHLEVFSSKDQNLVPQNFNNTLYLGINTNCTHTYKLSQTTTLKGSSILVVSC